LKKIEDERLAQEEFDRLAQEENNLMKWNRDVEKELMLSLNGINRKEDWANYSSCLPGYINVRKEKDLTGFIYEFKEGSDSVKKKT
jgi:hypothetical protein